MLSTINEIKHPDAAAVAGDREWFAKNPDRTYRLRAPGAHPVEWLAFDRKRMPAGTVAAVAVKRLAYGAYHGIPICLNPAVRNTEPEARAAHRLADELMRADGDAWVPSSLLEREIMGAA